jgi:hypothetical protein
MFDDWIAAAGFTPFDCIRGAKHAIEFASAT